MARAKSGNAHGGQAKEARLRGLMESSSPWLPVEDAPQLFERSIAVRNLRGTTRQLLADVILCRASVTMELGDLRDIVSTAEDAAEDAFREGYQLGLKHAPTLPAKTSAPRHGKRTPASNFPNDDAPRDSRGRLIGKRAAGKRKKAKRA